MYVCMWAYICVSASVVNFVAKIKLKKKKEEEQSYGNIIKIFRLICKIMARNAVNCVTKF